MVTGADLEFAFQMLIWLDLASIAKPGSAAAGLAEKDVSGDEKPEEEHTIEKEVNV